MSRAIPLVQAVEQSFAAAIRAAFPAAEYPALVMLCNNQKNGHYQCNSAMHIFKAAKGTPNCPTSPAACAQSIADRLDRSLFSKVDVIKTGFINVFINPTYAASVVAEQLRTNVAPPPVQKKKVMIDFSSPNIAKEMHVGHLRSTIIGDALARILEYLGHDVDRINHVGDWGTQFGMLIAHLKDTFPHFLEDPPRIGDLMSFYREAKKRFDEEEAFKTKAHQEVVRLQSGDVENLKAWTLICDVSRIEFEKIYKRLDVKLREVGESFYNPIIPKVIDELNEKGLVKEDGGAQCVFRSIKAFPLIVRKSDGGFTYDSTDCAAIWYRATVEKADWVIYVVDSGQGEHFELIFDTAKAAGWLSREGEDGTKSDVRVDHVGFGVVLGEDNKKFKTRSGDVVRLVDLLDEAVTRSRAILEERGVEGASKEEMDTMASVIGHGAVKYADLKSNRLTNYVFSFDRMLDLKGNTAVYLEYAHARISSVARKAGASDEEIAQMRANAKAEDLQLSHESEIELAVWLLRWPETVLEAAQDLMPHRIAEYLFELSVRFSAFYRDCQVVGSEQQRSRMLLCEATALALRKGFELLGITPLYKI